MDEEQVVTPLAERDEARAERARELITELVDTDQSIARLEGRKATILAELAQIADDEGADVPGANGPEYARRAMAADVAAATRIHPSAAKNRMEDSAILVSDFPTTHAALSDGRISKRHADLIADTGLNLDPGARASLDAHIVAFAETRTPRETEKIAKVQAEQLEPRSLRQRHLEAREQRRVVIAEREHGMSELWIYMPTLEARAIHDRITEMSRTIKSDRRRARAEFEREHGYAADEGWGVPVLGTPDSGDALGVFASDTRTMDQLRADLLADILLTAAPTGHELHSAGSGAALAEINATVQVTIPVSQIIDPEQGTSWIDAGGLIAPDTARILTGSTTGWERLFTKPETGEIVAVDRYRPSEQQRRALIGRDMTCRFPGCTTPARRSDIDHTRDYALDGETDIGNLAHLCEPHHVMKHHSGWRVRQLASGDMEWTSPTGGVYVNEPISRVFFREDPDIAEDRDRLRREQADRERIERERRERTREIDERRRAEYERAAEAARQQRYRDEAESYAAEADELAAMWSVEDEQALVTAILNGELAPPEGRPTELAPA